MSFSFISILPCRKNVKERPEISLQRQVPCAEVSTPFWSFVKIKDVLLKSIGGGGFHLKSSRAHCVRQCLVTDSFLFLYLCSRNTKYQSLGSNRRPTNILKHIKAAPVSLSFDQEFVALKSGEIEVNIFVLRG